MSIAKLHTAAQTAYYSKFGQRNLQEPKSNDNSKPGFNIIGKRIAIKCKIGSKIKFLYGTIRFYNNFTNKHLIDYDKYDKSEHILNNCQWKLINNKFTDIQTCVRFRDCDRARYLITELKVDINLLDRHDASPLYYASLTGNLEFIRFLAWYGATLDVDSFQAKRILSVALNSNTKNEIIKMFKTIPRRDSARWYNI